MSAFTRFLYLICSIFLIPYVLGSAASQYHLDVNSASSNCFIECHSRIEYTIEIPGTGSNGFAWITKICQQEQWINLMSNCLPIVCSSAPDVAYAIEYGENFCRRAGVEVTIPLPENYANSANGSYFKSEEYLASSSSPNIAIRSNTIFFVLSGVIGLSSLLS
ncbi:uncharacterized protein I303_101262 [Kwoniella dejecticola CBS 10117]|uniref:Extracellular membrane protein CFEM domain-containing protein n=1 Tax=Kwoniella dejecticola CBS 10117 TaxID=1296121 RepID=A0A1A6AH93_9TREE|nr:uncharacterized protein I303_01269 [Kwoniella dejecticola CBS 10117]OBR89442.1 hypothetical protein I303_01269 [Kwoniella dejecticola CBS 10117]